MPSLTNTDRDQLIKELVDSYTHPVVVDMIREELDRRGDLSISCGCCRGPVQDRCCCWHHQDVPHGIHPKKCSYHSRVAK